MYFFSCLSSRWTHIFCLEPFKCALNIRFANEYSSKKVHSHHVCFMQKWCIHTLLVCRVLRKTFSMNEDVAVQSDNSSWCFSGLLQVASQSNINLWTMIKKCKQKFLFFSRLKRDLSFNFWVCLKKSKIVDRKKHSINTIYIEVRVISYCKVLKVFNFKLFFSILQYPLPS